VILKISKGKSKRKKPLKVNEDKLLSAERTILSMRCYMQTSKQNFRAETGNKEWTEQITMENQLTDRNKRKNNGKKKIITRRKKMKWQQ